MCVNQRSSVNISIVHCVTAQFASLRLILLFTFESCIDVLRSYVLLQCEFMPRTRAGLKIHDSDTSMSTGKQEGQN